MPQKDRPREIRDAKTRRDKTADWGLGLNPFDDKIRGLVYDVTGVPQAR